MTVYIKINLLELNTHIQQQFKKHYEQSISQTKLSSQDLEMLHSIKDILAKNNKEQGKKNKISPKAKSLTKASKQKGIEL